MKNMNVFCCAHIRRRKLCRSTRRPVAHEARVRCACARNPQPFVVEGHLNLVNVLRAQPSLCQFLVFVTILLFSLGCGLYGFHVIGALTGYPGVVGVACYIASSYVGKCAAEAACICQ